MGEPRRKNPWLGLESYREGEVLYGRDDDIRDLTQSVLNDTDTLLYGKSGIGKSSILNAGIIPAARRYGYLPVLVRLSHKEQHSYLLQIRNAIANAMIPSASSIKEIVECKDKDNESLYEFFHRHTFHNANGDRIKLLIIFDQFEEIFTLQSDESKKKRFFAELADFLNDIMPSELQHEVVTHGSAEEEAKVVADGNFDDLFNDLDLGIRNDLPEYVFDNNIHLIFTIREDYLSDFEYYSAAIPSLKQNRYGLRPINEEQASQIILRPMPGLIEESVAKLIIEKVTGRTDFELDGIPEIEVDSAVLSLYLNRLYDAKTGETITSELVEQKGGEIIADFYSDAIANISEKTTEYLEDMLLNGQGRRDNITVYDAINDGGITEKELDVLCNKKKILRQFNYAGDLRIEYVHDILCPIVKAHREGRLLLKQQEEERLRQEHEKQELIRQQREKLEEIEKANARQRRRNRYRVGIAFSLLALATIGWFTWQFFTQWEFKSCYASFTVKNGWPVGIGKELNDNDKCQMPVYYQLVRYGWNSQNTRVNVLNTHNQLSHNIFKESPLVGLYETEGSDEKAKGFASLQRQTAYWIYTPDNDGHLLRITAYGIDEGELYAVQFFRSTVLDADGDANDSQKKQLWANYVDKDGKAMRIRDNGADRIRIIADDSTGYHIGYQFYSETGTPQPNNMGVYGYRYKLEEDGCVSQKIPVDAFGDLLYEETIMYDDYDDYGRWTKNTKGQAVYSNQFVAFSLNNRKDTLKFGQQGELVYHSETKPNGTSRVFLYEKDQVVKIYHYRENNGSTELTYSREVRSNKKASVIETMEYWADSLIRYRIKREEHSTANSTISYFGGESPSSIVNPQMVTMKVGQYHKIVIDTTYKDGLSIVEKTYLDTRGNPSHMCKYNRDVAYYNSNKEMLKHIVYKDGTRIYAYLNEYEDGQIVAQSVMGIDDSTAIRYAGWDQYGLCYYKMKMVYNFSNTLVAIKGLNEFGEESLITTPSDENYIISIVPSIEMSVTTNDADIYGTQVYKIQTPSVNKGRKVEYIHILSKNGTWYRSGVKDGDLLVQDGNPIKIARPNISKKTYDILTIPIPNGKTGADHYSVFFTNKEMERYNNAIK